MMSEEQQEANQKGDTGRVLQLLYKSPCSLIVPGERRSKLIDPNSELYAFAERAHQFLRQCYCSVIEPKRMDFHTELCNQNDWSEQTVTERCKMAHGSPIAVESRATWIIDYERKYIGLKGPVVPGYGATHITIGYFKSGVPEDAEATLIKGGFIQC